MFFAYVFGGKISAGTLPIVPVAGTYSSPLTLELDDTGRIIGVSMSWLVGYAYPQNARVLGPTDCLVYEAQIANTGNDPETDDGTNWLLADFRCLYLDGSRPMAGTLSMGGFGITNTLDPVNPQDVATKAYVGAVLAGIRDPKDAAQLVATGNIALNGVIVVDGISSNAAGVSRVLCIGQTDPTQNGWYTPGAGAWTRCLDADSSGEMTNGASSLISMGTHRGDVWMLSTADPIVLGVTNLVFINIMSLASLLPMGVDGQTVWHVGGVWSAVTVVDGEVPAGAADGANLIFTFAHAPQAGSLHLYSDGIRMVAGVDYNLVGAVATFISADQTPKTTIEGDYRY